MIRRFVNIGKGKPINIDDYLTFEALVDNSSVHLFGNSCEYCIDGDGNWIILDNASNAPILSAGQTISFRAELQPTKENGIGLFICEGAFNLRGNCMSMLFSDNGKNSVSLEGKDYAFKGLFSHSGSCIKSVSDNFLPATILSIGCYQSMFTYCDFEKAPILPALILKQYCYEQMFWSCENLNYIKMLATDISATNCLYGWVNGVSSTGTFVKNPDATWEVYGSSGIPNGWTVKFDGEEDEGTYDDIFGELPPESTSFEFPLYLNITELDYEDADCKEYIRNSADDIIVQLTNWFDANYRVHNSYDGSWEYINLDESHQIYINGSLITQLKRQPWTTAIECFPAPSPFTECFAELDFLYGIVYK